MPTVPSFKIAGNGGFSAAKTEWIVLIKELELQKCSGFVLPSFGRLTAEQAGRIVYKHMNII